MSVGPEGKAASENTDAVVNATAKPKAPAKKAAPKPKPEPKTTSGSPEEGAPLPEPRTPNDPVPEGVVEVTRKATDKEVADPKVGTDPAGNIAKTDKAVRAPRAKKDPLKDIDNTKLPIAVHVGQVAAQVKEHSGLAVLSIGLVGWVGEPEFQIRAEDVSDLEDALANLRKQLS